MEKTSIDDIDSDEFGDSERRRVAERVGADEMAINHYRVAPGEGLPAGLHAHMDQEEVFIVLAGTARFETLDGEISVEDGEIIRFAPGEYQSGFNGGTEQLEILALGAPKDSEDVRLPIECLNCSHDNLRFDFSDGEMTFVCPDCDSEFTPEPCPDCGSENLQVTLIDDVESSDPQTGVQCENCDAVFDSPPLRE